MLDLVKTNEKLPVLGETYEGYLKVLLKIKPRLNLIEDQGHQKMKGMLSHGHIKLKVNYLQVVEI